MGQKLCNLHYLAIVLISTTIILSGLGIDKTDLQTNVSARSPNETSPKNVGVSSAYFEENKGQFNQKVKYLLRGATGYSLFLTATEAVYVLSDKKQENDKRKSKIITVTNPELEISASSSAVAVFMTLEGSSPDSETLGSDMLDQRTSYFKGSDESKWYTNIPNYLGICKQQIYKGIDLVWRGKENDAVQYDFIIQPYADPNQIEWKIQGAKSVQLTTEGDLIITTDYGVIKQNKPFTYQEANRKRSEIDSGYIIETDSNETIEGGKSFRVKFTVGSYDQSNQLFIDPLVTTSGLIFSTFLGDARSDWGNAIAVDTSENIYVAGRTQSPLFPTTPGVFDPSQNGEGFTDVFVTKLNSTGSALIYSTFIGGAYDDDPFDIAVDSFGKVYVTGRTYDHPNICYPTTAGAYDTTHNGVWDVFVTKLNATGSALDYSTFIGGSGWDQASGIALDTLGNAFVTGFTFNSSVNYPTTTGAFQTTHHGYQAVFVTKLNASGSALIYSTYVSGNNHEGATDIDVDSAENVFITGGTISDDYPTTTGAYDTTHNGVYDVFITKLNPTGSTLDYSTFIGGSDHDIALGMAVDSSGDTFVTGETTSIDFPTTEGSFDTTYNGGNFDIFVTKLNSSGSSLKYSTYIGGLADDQATGITIDSRGNAFLTGETTSNDYPTTAGAFDTTYNNNRDALVTKLNSAGSGLLYSTFIGGGNSDGGSAITIDSTGTVFLTGYAGISYPTTPGAFDTFTEGDDAFVTKLNVNTALSTEFDYDGDNKSDISVFRPSNGAWYLDRSQEGFFGTLFGLGDDKITPADFDGDGKTDIAVYRPSTGIWYWLNSSNGAFNAIPFGIAEDLPAPADYDGDGKADVCIFRPSNGTWYRLNSSDGSLYGVQFGLNEDKPTIGDFDGDGKTDIAVFRPSTGSWFRINSSTNSFYGFQWGISTDLIVPADYDGDGKTDVAVFRPSNSVWYIFNSLDSSFNYAFWGTTGDIPAPADFDGDGKADINVFRPSDGNWYRMNSSNGQFVPIHFGQNGDKPTQAAFQY